jgi:hypothetical protein
MRTTLMRHSKDTGEWNVGGLWRAVREHRRVAVIRRDVLHLDSDLRSVKWWLVAALIALSIGLVAEFAKLRHGVAQEVTQTDSALVSVRVDPFAGN